MIDSLDPAPRAYPRTVSLIRRGTAGPAAAPPGTTLAGIEDWLLGDAVNQTDMMAKVEGLVWRLVAAGLAVDRVTFHIGTLHPQMIGYSWFWARSDIFCDETRVDSRSLQSASYQNNPLRQVIEFGEKLRLSPRDPESQARFAMMAELADEGYVDYVAMPLAGDQHHNVATFATMRPGGFSDEEIEAVRRVMRLFALHVKLHTASQIAANVLDTYVGRAAGDKVLAGAIRQGTGEAIQSVIWMSDLRGFTLLSDRLAPECVNAILNAAFDVLAGAVLAQGGEVLKFIGDGLLAVFPLDREFAGQSAPTAAYTAAQQGLAGLAELNVNPPSGIAKVEGWRPLRAGIALHEGEVFHGNVGSPERLDFTVIGRAVNETARVEAMTKELGRSLLITGPVACHLPHTKLDPLGVHHLRGVGTPIELFAPSED